MNDLVSIIIPMYNVENYVRNCIKSCCRQTYRNIEIIVVDDGSIDSSYAIVKELAEQDSRIKLYQKSNTGVSDTRNFALNKVKGQFIVYIDADDYIDKAYVSKMLEYMQEDVDIVACHLLRVDKNGEPIENKKVLQLRSFQMTESYDFSEDIRLLSVAGTIIRKSIINNHLFDSNIFIGEDALFVNQLMVKANKIIIIPEYLYYYVTNQTSAMWSSYTDKKFTMVYAWERICKLYYEFPLAYERCLGELALHCYSLYREMIVAGVEKTDEGLKLLELMKQHYDYGIKFSYDRKTKVFFWVLMHSRNLFKLIFLLYKRFIWKGVYN